MSELSQYEVSRMLTYDRSSGKFYWAVKPSRAVNVGDSAGCKTYEGYVQIRVKGKPYLAHRLAFLIAAGFMPIEIDHINGDKGDNSWTNLRECTRTENMRNKRKRSDSTGITGVAWHAKSSKWRVHAGAGKRKISIYHDSLIDAVADRLRLEKELCYSARHGR